MDREQIFVKVKGIIAYKIDIPEEQISLDTHLPNDLNLDSFDKAELVWETEKEFGIEFPGDEWGQLTQYETVGDLVDLVYKLQNQ